MNIPIYKPYLPKKSLVYAHEALDSTWISSQGKYIQMVTEKLQQLLNVKYVLPLNNGTSACHLMAKCVSQFHNYNNASIDNKLRIIVPNNVYVAAWNAFLFDNKFELITVKADLDTWNINLDHLDEKIQEWPNCPVLIVHNIGNIVNVPQLKKKYPNTLFVEDNCEGFLGKYQGAQAGTASYVSAISFFGNKNITSGEGGALVTDDENAYLFVKNIHSQGQSPTRFIHNNLGYNYRMTNIQAAILYGQLEILPEILEKKKIVFDIYRSAFKDRDDIIMQQQIDNTQHSNWMFGIRLPAKQYQDAESYFKEYGIETRPMFYPIYTHPHLDYNPDVKSEYCLNAEVLNYTCMILPSYPELTPEEQRYIISTLDNFMRKD